MVKQLILDFLYKNRLPQSWGVQSCVKIESESLWIWISQEAVGFYLHFRFPGRDVSWCFLNFVPGTKQKCKVLTKRYGKLSAAAGRQLVLSPCACTPSLSCSALYLEMLSYACQWGFFKLDHCLLCAIPRALPNPSPLSARVSIKPWRWMAVQHDMVSF